MNATYYWLAMPAAVMLFGGILTFFWHPSKSLIGLVQHLAAGIILAALMIEVFPEMRRTNIAQSSLIFSFVVGVLFVPETFQRDIKSDKDYAGHEAART